MIIREWEIWHTYSSYFSGPAIDTERAASALVKCELAQFAAHRDGRSYWLSKGTLQAGTIEIQSHPDGSQASFGLRPDDGSLSPEGFAREACFQAAHLRCSEFRVLGDRVFPPDYVRAFLGEYRLTSAARSLAISMYPILKLYSSGVVLLEFRIIGPPTGISISEFIADFVNLPFAEFDQAHVSPALAKLAPRSYYRARRPLPLHLRAALTWLERGHDRAVASESSEEKSGDFTFSIAPLPSDGSRETLAGIALTIFSTVAYLLSQPKPWLAYIIRGHPRTYQLGNYWSGRPHIHITRFDDQKDSAEENLRNHNSMLTKIYLRQMTMPRQHAAFKLPPDSHLFDDYNAIIGSHVSLWIWSGNGLRTQEPWKDANRGYLIYEHQVIVEVLEYGAINQRTLFETSLGATGFEFIYTTRLALARSGQDMEEATHFEELRDLLARGWEQMGILRLQERTAAILAVREAQSALVSARRSERLSRMLAIVFGLVAVPPLADQIIKPLWMLLKLPLPKNSHLAELTRIAVAIVAIVIILTFAYFIPWRSGRKRDVLPD